MKTGSGLLIIPSITVDHGKHCILNQGLSGKRLLTPYSKLVENTFIIFAYMLTGPHCLILGSLGPRPFSGVKEEKTADISDYMLGQKLF